MTGDVMIKCPDCGTQFPLNKALSKDIEAGFKAKYKDQLEAAESDIRAEVKKEIEKQSSSELKDLKTDLEAKEKALAESKENEIKLRRERRDLEEREKNLKLEVERTIDNERRTIADKAAQAADDAHRLKDAEKDKKISDTLAQMEELKRRMEQGSQKIQGEVFEVELENTLRAMFPLDTIDPVAPGVKGGDILHTVNTRSGREAGRIMWELKRTRSFSDSWIPKLKADARNCKADICLLVSETMPDNIDTFSEIDGVWVCSIPACVSLAHVLRQTLILVMQEKSLQTGKKSKAELMYEYLTGTEFKGRIEAIIEAFKGMKEDLDSEKRAMDKIWAKREKQIGQVLLNISGMHGDIESLAGNALPSINALKLGYESKGK
jgi:hypothetical protein